MICVSQVGGDKSLVMCDPEKYISLVICVFLPGRGTLGICVSWVGEHISQGRRGSRKNTDRFPIQPDQSNSNTMHEGDGFLAKSLGKACFIVKMTAPAMVWPTSFDFWKAPI